MISQGVAICSLCRRGSVCKPEGVEELRSKREGGPHVYKGVDLRAKLKDKFRV